MTDPSLKNIQDRMVPNLAKKSRDRNNQWLKPASYDKKMYDTIDQTIDLDQEEINDKFDNFSVQNAIKKNTKAPLREEDWIAALSALSEDELNEIINEDEALEIFIEQTLRTSIKRGAGYGAAAGAAVGGIGGLGAGRLVGGAIGSKVGEAGRGADVGGVAGGAAGGGAGAAVGAVAGGVAGAAAHGVRKLANKVRNRNINEAEIGGTTEIPSNNGQENVNELYEDEALDLLEEIMDILEDDDNEFSSYCWTDTVSFLKQARDCLIRNIVSEEVELTEEHFKAGSIKLKDKTFVKISKKDAKVLNAAASGTDNKSKLINTATKSKKDFDEFLEFAYNLDENFSDTIDDLLNEATADELDYIIENDLNESESWEIIKNSTKIGVNVGKNVGKVAGAVGGGVYGATGGSVLALTKAIVKRQKRKASVNKMFAEDDKKSVLGTSAPATDSEEVNLQEISKPKLEKYLNKAIEDHGHANFARNSTRVKGKESENTHWTRRTTNRKIGISRAIDRLNRKKLQESGGLGGHSANYRNPAEGRIKFRSVETPVKPGEVLVITNNKKNIDGKLATKVGDGVNVKFSNVWHLRMEVIEMLPNNQIKVRAYQR